jgi:DNA-directed RNA polymerase subunit RPC12/RpoP
MPQVGENWICPYCGHHQVLAQERYRVSDQRWYVTGWKEG